MPASSLPQHATCVQVATQIATSLGFVVVLVDVSVVNVALHALQTAFRTNVTGLQWVVNAYAMIFASSLLLAGALGVSMTARYARRTAAQPRKRIDLPGQITGALALTTLTFSLTEASALGWNSPIILSALLLCVALGSAFIWLEAHGSAPMLPLTLFSDRTVSAATIIGMLTNLAFYGIVFTFSLFFQSIWHWTPERTGLAFLPMMAILMVMNVMAARLVSRIGARALTTIGLMVSAGGYLLMLPALDSQSYWPLVLPMLLAGGGIALALPTITNALLAAVSGTHAGTASGLFNAARQVGGVIGVAVFGAWVRHSQTLPFLHGMERALVASAGLLVLAAAIAHCYLSAQENRTEENTTRSDSVARRRARRRARSTI